MSDKTEEVEETIGSEPWHQKPPEPLPTKPNRKDET